MRRALVCILLAAGLAATASPVAAQRRRPLGPEVPLLSIGAFGSIVAGESDVTLFGAQVDLPIAPYMSFVAEANGFVATVTCAADPNATCDASGAAITIGPRMWFLGHSSPVAPYVMGLAGFGWGGEVWEPGIAVLGALGAEGRIARRIGLWADAQVRWVVDDATGSDYGMSVGVRYMLPR